MTTADPQVTVLMAVRNGGAYLPMAVESILNQTYRNFTFLIMDDASTDDTREVIRAYADPRIELVSVERNVGQTAALNLGLRRCRTPWMARMDADDYSAPTRLEEQMRALEADPRVACLGAHSWFFRDDPQVMDELIQKPADHDGIRRAMLEGSPIVHGSIVIKRDVLLAIGGYDERYRYSADLELYSRLLPAARAANLPKLLLGVRRHAAQGSLTLRAADENIEIYTRLIASGTFLRAELPTVRSSLAYFYLTRARLRHGQGSYRGLVQDLAAAVHASPATACKLSSTYFLVKPLRRRLARPAHGVPA